MADRSHDHLSLTRVIKPARRVPAILSVLPLIAAACATAPARRAATGPDPVPTVTHLFRAMEARDTAAVRALFLPGARLASIQLPERPPRVMTVDQFVDMVGRAPEPYRESMEDLTVESDGVVATVHGRYEFRVGSRMTNCGVNSIGLLFTAGEWRIASLLSSIHVSPEACGDEMRPR